MKKNVTLFVLLILHSVAVTVSAAEKEKKSFVDVFPGTPIVTIFANYHQGLNSESESNFAFKRGYIGYEFDDEKAWSGKVIFDITTADISDEKLMFDATLKNAFVRWQNYGFDLNIGMIPTKNFTLQEKIWGHRYIMEGYMSEYGYAPSADLGVSVAYKFNDLFEADFTFANGEGNTKMDFDNYSYGFGLIYTPIEHFSFKGYYNLYTKERGGEANESALSIFAGYTDDIYSLGMEYNYMINSDFVQGVDMNGGSVFGTMKVLDKLFVFARYDYVLSNDSHSKETGFAVRTGVEYAPVKFFKISPNFYGWNPKNGAAENFLYLNLLLNF